MQPTHCPKCNIELTANQYWLSCQQETNDHVFLFNLSENSWFLKVGSTYINYNQEKYYFSTRGNIPINYIDPFPIEQANNVLNRYVKLMAFL